MTITYRYAVLAGVFIMLYAGVLWRLFDVQIRKSDFLTMQGQMRSVRTQTTVGTRGILFDRHGAPLAVSTLIHSVWVNPQQVPSSPTYLTFLSRLLEIPAPTLAKRLAAHRHKHFVYLKRHITPAQGDKIKSLKIPGVHVVKESRRFYPEGQVSSQVIGFNNIDDIGQEGLELAYNSLLAGGPHTQTLRVSLQGQVLERLSSAPTQQAHGTHIHLSLDRRVQYLAYQALEAAVIEHQAEFGSVVILDVNTAEVLAMANYPSFNPNHRDKADRHHVRNIAVTDVFEFGSVMKTFSMASALENNAALTLQTPIDTSPGQLFVKGGVVRDRCNFGYLSLQQILARSSNVGIAKLVLENSAEKLMNLYLRLGLTQPTGIDFPGEGLGSMLNPHQNAEFELATMSFGYGVSATALQLARAYTVLGAEGQLRSVTLLKQDKPGPAEQVLDPKVAADVLHILTNVVEHGSGKRARVPGYTVAGKTGTARLLGAHGYDEERHLATFAGIVPACAPRFVIVALINEPKSGKYYGSAVAAPLFSEIAAQTLRLYNIVPS